MKQITLNGKKMTDKNTAHEYIAKKLGFPEYYGKNLDALADCLSEFCIDRFIIISNSVEMKNNLGEYADNMIEVFKTVADDTPNLRFKLM